MIRKYLESRLKELREEYERYERKRKEEESLSLMYYYYSKLTGLELAIKELERAIIELCD